MVEVCRQSKALEQARAELEVDLEDELRAGASRLETPPALELAKRSRQEVDVDSQRWLVQADAGGEIVRGRWRNALPRLGIE